MYWASCARTQYSDLKTKSDKTHKIEVATHACDRRVHIGQARTQGEHASPILVTRGSHTILASPHSADNSYVFAGAP